MTAVPDDDMTVREQVLGVYQRLLAAWNARDAEAFAALLTDAGSVVGFDGSAMNGREEVRSALRDIFGTHPTARYVAKVRELRSLGADIYLVRAVVGMVPPGKAELNPAVNAIQSLVCTGRGPGLRIALLHNTPAAFHGRPELAEQLTRELTDALLSGRIVTAAGR